jgi:hypothetical protein
VESLPNDVERQMVKDEGSMETLVVMDDDDNLDIVDYNVYAMEDVKASTAIPSISAATVPRAKEERLTKWEDLQAYSLHSLHQHERSSPAPPVVTKEPVSLKP